MAFVIAYKPTFVIVDAYNFFIRHYVVNPTMDSNGEAAGGVVGTLKGLRNLVDRFKPTAMFVCWDGEGSAERRRSIRSEYKEGRKVRLNREYDFDSDAKVELKNMDSQVKRVSEYIDMLGVHQVRAAGVEADDIIAYLSTILGDCRCIVVSTDSDLLQIVNDDVQVYNPVKDQIIRKEDVLKEKDCLPSNFACLKAICGDKGDNVSGVPGVGPKSVTKLVPELATEEDMGLGKVLDLIDDRVSVGKKKDKKAEAISAMRDHIEENMKLVSLKDPLMSADAARYVRSSLEVVNEFKPMNVRIKLINDGIQLSEDIDRQFTAMASRSSLWAKSKKEK